MGGSSSKWNRGEAYLSNSIFFPLFLMFIWNAAFSGCYDLGALIPFLATKMILTSSSHACAGMVVRWGADGVIVGSATVKILSKAESPKEGLKELENFTKLLMAAVP